MPVPAVRDELPVHLQGFSDNQLEFIRIRLEYPHLSGGEAVRRAYPNVTTDNSSRVMAHTLLHNPKIIAALKAEAQARLDDAGMIGASVLVEIARDPTHKDRFKAASSLLNRIGLHERTEHTVNVKKPTDDVEVARQIVALAKELNMDPRTLLGPNAAAKYLKDDGSVVDAEFTIVERAPAPVTGSTEGLEDVL